MNQDELKSAIRRGLERLSDAQDEDGSFPGDYGGPLFLLPLFILTARCVGLELSDDEAREMIRYIQGQQNADGGWGLHVEGASTVYGSTSNYVALRLLGVDADSTECRRARSWLNTAGGPLGSASWGKFFLSLCGLYEWRGLNPLMPELWLLPTSLPIHPSKLWCHCRMVYLPMSYLYAERWSFDDPIVAELKEE
ncbi:MAG: squalene--hopene cyclase, partial [Polyangiaceae bacterium]|nr:squalene--hopene cyclase [Polyangiaceae bacterium]